ncbi:MAG: 2-oxoacid:acceptor oxidoreductase family protein [Firmicutes bacterium]|nr:2-oxoacid:acceptor oxidoreductase family protein [Bacillota bacterium]MBR5329106.1 2-oxoacid:acceptor oxidoreductase family protein [Bacillota bacterium]
MKNNIRLTGTGGQGLILAGIILAEAALLEGKNAIQSQSYGPEARGGASKAEVIIADEAIHFPKVQASDYLLCMSEKAYEKYNGGMKQDSVLIIDTTFVEEVENPKAKTTYAIPITELAIKATGKEMTANICALGIISALGIVDEDALQKAILKRIPKGTEELNMKAFEAGKNAVK